MPKLKGKNIAPAVGPSAGRLAVSKSEIIVGCPLVTPCGWETVRPLRGAHSAQVAHKMRHDRGLL